MDNLHINIFSFRPQESPVGISFFSTEENDRISIYKNQIPIGVNISVNDNGRLYWKEGEFIDGIFAQVDLNKNKRFAKSYFRKVVHDFFLSQGLIMKDNFVNDTEIWIKSQDKYQGVTNFKRFTVKVDNNRLISDLSLLISFDGVTYVSKMSLSESVLAPEIISKVLYKNSIKSYNDLTDAEREDTGNIYPILNRQIRQQRKISVSEYNKNKYKTFYTEVSAFVRKYLNSPNSIPKINLTSSDFVRLNSSLVEHTNEDSNLLLFGNDNSHFNPYQGLKDFGPLELPRNQNIKLIFIFHKDDKEAANKLYSYLKKGYKSFLGLNSFTRIQFSVDTANSINFENDETPIVEVREALKNRVLDEQFQYAAIYISRIKKDGNDDDKDIQYYRIKEELLKYRITSQVIYKDNIFNELFNFFLPNIAVALLAKLGGVPWRLKRPIKKDLVIGVGAYRPFHSDQPFIGNAFCFLNDGRFKGFNSFESANAQGLADLIKNSIDQYIRENSTLTRVIIHFYKEVSNEELKPIRSVLHGLRLSIPVIIVTVFKTESKDYVVFDYDYDGIMPSSGVIVKLKPLEYLLCNNSRYSQATGSRVEGFPFPIKLKFYSTDNSILNDTEIIRELIDQVYQFSRMYWKSVKQKSLPVTIEYSEMVAEMVSKFESTTLPTFGKNNLWFL